MDHRVGMHLYRTSMRVRHDLVNIISAVMDVSAQPMVKL